MMITVAKLIELLRKEDQTRVVILQKDSEGNGFSPFAGLWQGAYVDETGWYGEAYIDKLTDELRAEGYSEDDLPGDDAVPALILWPVN